MSNSIKMITPDTATPEQAQLIAAISDAIDLAQKQDQMQTWVALLGVRLAIMVGGEQELWDSMVSTVNRQIARLPRKMKMKWSRNEHGLYTTEDGSYGTRTYTIYHSHGAWKVEEAYEMNDRHIRLRTLRLAKELAEAMSSCGSYKKAREYIESYPPEHRVLSHVKPVTRGAN